MVVLMRPGCHALIAAATIAAACIAPGHAQTPRTRLVRVTAERFTFTPSQITVTAGEQVELRLKSEDTAHGFRIHGIPVNVIIPKRGHDELVVSFRADTPGRYLFECSRMCGAGHNFMRGTLIVRAAGDTR
jgi:cytochrome c oxidase subunit 2